MPLGRTAVAKLIPGGRPAFEPVRMGPVSSRLDLVCPCWRRK